MYGSVKEGISGRGGGRGGGKEGDGTGGEEKKGREGREKREGRENKDESQTPVLRFFILDLRFLLGLVSVLSLCIPFFFFSAVVPARMA